MSFLSQLSQNDRKQIHALGIRDETLEYQLKCLTEGVPPVVLDRPCRVGDGIRRLEVGEAERLAALFEEKAQAPGRVGKFVPASGAATRMFAVLMAYLMELASGTQVEPEGLPRQVREFFSNLQSFPFAEELRAALVFQGHSGDFSEHLPILQALLTRQGLGYSHLPKALIPFHRYPEGSRTALEEHLHEGLEYLRDASGVCRLHFTCQAEWQERIRDHVQEILQKFRTPNSHWEVGYSPQKSSTQTLAIDLQDRPFREKNGNLLFRPGGHGSLLENLNDLQGDIVFIKNIDNVVPDRLQARHRLYKKALGGLLVETQDRIFSLLRRLEETEDQDVRQEALKLSAELCRPLPKDLPGGKEGIARILEWFERPIRVCGVVPNIGEPGGGPYWVKGKCGEITPQIVESAQIDSKDPGQQQIFSQATHFNPVDLVCGLRDFQGRPFDLKRFVDPQAVFISHKTHQGRPLRALEWPGLWNGSMAEWFTLFVEVPLETFNPVKTVLDLLRPEHRQAAF